MRCANPSPIPILVYHQIDVAPDKGQPFRSLYVTPTAFARQMRLLHWLGYKGLSMSDLQPYLLGQRSGKVVGITFDDGYVNNLTHAAPVLKRHKFSSTCYAVSSLAGETNRWDRGIGIAQVPLMNAEQMRLWVAAGQEIGSHTHTHADLTAANDIDCHAEIEKGKAELEQILDEKLTHFCYPFGRYEPRHVEMAHVAGFETATTTQRGRCWVGSEMLQLSRVPVLRSTSLPLFWLKVATAYEDRRGK